MAKVCKSGGEGTFAERHGNGEVAPIPVVRETAIEPPGSTQLPIGRAGLGRPLPDPTADLGTLRVQGQKSGGPGGW
jgi:hypothetical protein